ncbi:TolC family protein [Colwellia psychrerythraea]|uniref:Putative cation efflux protein n=1 Tax=Colwellia psychrerythraea (strain 34H / ATCC BAA-681) TaxID=167879 RepID=Q47UM7_COLP3|nr:TolC family protein [Colwellia psychrerythraea]AAZ27753.1 putative cation efflux protein [Colwellia psychrerythraea 34H]
MFLFSFPVQARATVASIITLSVLCAISPTLQAADNKKVWSFNSTVTTAQKNDPWLTGNKHQQQAVEAMSNAASSLPDPKMSVAFANLPTDGFDFSQEGMTQLKVGITQMFPRGDSLTIKNQQLRIQSEAYPFQRNDRKAKVAVTVGSLWLDAYYVQQSSALIEQNRSLFEQLADVAQASYSSTLGKTRQQDIVRAQLELTQLDDRLDRLAQQQNSYLGRLSQWLSTAFLNDPMQVNIAEVGQLQNMKLAKQLPQLDLLHEDLNHSGAARSNADRNGLSSTSLNNPPWLSVEELTEQFVKHPAVIALDKKILATKTGINLAEQAYQPEWGINASYGYRDDDPSGNNRADLFSVGVTFDLPLFTDNRQDMTVKSAVSATEAVKTEKILLLRQLLGAFSSAQGRLSRLNNRKTLYQTRLLPQIHDQAEASLTAYTNDDGDFSEVVRSRIAVLNAEIEQLKIAVEQQKIILELNYLFVGSLATNNTSKNPQQTFAQREEK